MVCINSISDLLEQYRAKEVPAGNFNIKIILVGETGVGKTSITFRFVENRFLSNYITTLGVNIMGRAQNLRTNTIVNWILWDMGGQESYGTYRRRFYAGAAAAFLVFDKTNAESFQCLENRWVSEIEEAGIQLEMLPVIVIANKIDLVDQAQVTTEDMQDCCSRHHFDFIETSAKEGTNVEEAFELLAYKYLENC